jgi:hypothetical protein
MSTTPETTAPAHRDEGTIPPWLEALGRAPWSLFFPTCSSYWLSGVRTPRRRPQVKP